MNKCIQELIDLAEQLARRQGVRTSTLANRVMNDGDFFKRLANGGDCNTRTYERVKAWLESQLRTEKGDNERER